MIQIQPPEQYRAELHGLMTRIKTLTDLDVRGREVWLARKERNTLMRRMFHEHYLPNWHIYSFEERESLEACMARMVDEDERIEGALNEPTTV